MSASVAAGAARVDPGRATTAPPAPAAPATVYTEDFENGQSAPGTAIFLNGYTGATGETYTADPAWINGGACNGLIGALGSSVGTSGCDQTDYNNYTPVAAAIGSVFGGDNANHALLDLSLLGSPTPLSNLAVFQTVNPIPLPASGHFIVFSVDVGAVNCTLAQPSLSFFAIEGAELIPQNATPLDPCTDSRATTSIPSGIGPIVVGRYPADTATLVNGSSVGVELTNAQTDNNGNDYGLDNIRVLDATPQLTDDFATPAVAGQPDMLTFTITNTTELAAKDGWSFTDNLPTGMTVASTPDATTTCANSPAAPAITAAAGSSTIAATGNLAAGQSSCTVSVSVVAPAGSYTNGPSNISSSTGLLPPPSTSVMVNPIPTTAAQVAPSVHHHAGGRSSNDPDFDASNDPGGEDVSSPDYSSATCRAACSVTVTLDDATVDVNAVDQNTNAGRYSAASISRSNHPVLFAARDGGGAEPDCPGYRNTFTDWVQFGFTQAERGAGFRKTVAFTLRRTTDHGTAVVAARSLQICFEAPYRFQPRPGYGIALHDASYYGVLPQCRAVRVRPPLPGVPTPCVATREVVRSGNGWTVRIAFRVPAGTQDPKALG
ncbi:MAG TPA: hypothetical protein VHV82_04025 [Sporichthyaceae bacterium]|nr:hypothetical protein [Sporichthyaceae bacterium]